MITFAHLCKLKKKTSIKAVDSSSLHAISWISKNDSSYSVHQAKSLYISHAMSYFYVFLAYFDIPKIHLKAKTCGVFTFILFNFEVRTLQCAENSFYICFAHENIKKMPPSKVAYFSLFAVMAISVLFYKKGTQCDLYTMTFEYRTQWDTP